jgi:chromosome segregation ATPase
MDDVDAERAAWAKEKAGLEAKLSSTETIAAEHKTKAEKLEAENASLKKKVEDITEERDDHNFRAERFRSYWNTYMIEAIALRDEKTRLEVQKAKYRRIAGIVKEGEERPAAN